MCIHQIVKGAYLFLLNQNQILLSKRKNTTHFQDYYGVISGNVWKNESFEAAIIREAREETGIHLQKQNLKVVHVMHRIDKQDESMYVFFIAKKWIGEIKNKEPNRCEELIWTPIENLPQNIVPYVEDAIKYYRTTKYFSEFIWQ